MRYVVETVVLVRFAFREAGGAWPLLRSVWAAVGSGGLAEIWRACLRVRARLAAVRHQDHSRTHVNEGLEKYRAFYESWVRSAGHRHLEQAYEPLDETGTSLREGDVKLIAFYLPQYHPIPLNDANWGRGFTEWTNVSKAVPQFVGHYQPRLPGELGFYDLRVPDIQRRQVELAKLYGISAFCFHYYWFAGRRLLEGPVERFVQDQSLDLSFCLCWANENWTRRWDGLEHEVLVAQEHSPADDLALIRSMEHMFRDPRYLRVDGKPLFIVYRPALLPDALGTVARWRRYCEEAGLCGVYLVAAQTFGLEDPTKLGFDAAVEFPPHNVAAIELSEPSLLNPHYSGHVYDYEDLVRRRIHRYDADAQRWLTFRTVMPSWDNEARRPGAGHAFVGSTPALYEAWLTEACRVTERRDKVDERLVFINAWNEWGEGAYLEPDRRYGYAYLAATKRVVERRRARAARRVAVILHLFYADLWSEFHSYLSRVPRPFDLYVSVPAHLPDRVVGELARDYPAARITVVENRGRDILPFLGVLSGFDLEQYEYVCKVHTKKTVHRTDGGEWRTRALDDLLGSEDQIRTIWQRFENDPRLAMVAPRHSILQSIYYWGLPDHAVATRRHITRLAARAGLDEWPAEFYFPAGSMFWFRPGVFGSLRRELVQGLWFEDEAGQKDGTLAHAMERFLGLFALATGHHIGDVDGRIVRREDCQFAGDGSDVIRSPWAVPTVNGRPI